MCRLCFCSFSSILALQYPRHYWYQAAWLTGHLRSTSEDVFNVFQSICWIKIGRNILNKN